MGADHQTTGVFARSSNPFLASQNRAANGHPLHKFPSRLHLVFWIAIAIFLIAFSVLFWFAFAFQPPPEPERKGAAVAVQRSKSEANLPRKFKQTFFFQTIGGLSVIGLDIYLCKFLPAIDKAFFVWFPPVAIVTLLIGSALFAGIADPLVEDAYGEWLALSGRYFVLLMFTW
jgi:hypothetical protein